VKERTTHDVRAQRLVSVVSARIGMLVRHRERARAQTEAMVAITVLVAVMAALWRLVDAVSIEFGRVLLSLAESR
jgi:hypothetical protein